MKNVAVLGCGLVGSYIIRELQKDKNIQVSIYDKTLDSTLDLSKKQEIEFSIRDADIVVNALPGYLGYRALEVAISQGKDVVDISFMPEDFTKLDKEAKEMDVTAVVDFGFAPGLCHMVVADHIRKLGNVDECEIYVGGLPANEEDEYKAVFSPKDVIEEYTRPARYKANNQIITEDPFVVDYGDEALSAFISDGLRSLLDINIPNLVEFTYRYRKHFNKMKALKDRGSFLPKNIEEITKTLTNQWRMPDNFEDWSLLTILSRNKDKELMFSLEDFATGSDHSMARVTGIPAIIMTKLLVNGYKQPGVITPENIYREVLVEILFELESAGVKIKENTYELD